MTNSSIFELNNYDASKLKESFSKNSIVQINQLVPSEICKKTDEFIKENESEIIDKYKSNKRSLVLDSVNGNLFIKYFDKPLDINFDLFSNFLNSRIFNIGKLLLGEDVILKRFELHSRCAFGSPIPPHQDNAYFGLKNAKSLTFYISLNDQISNEGGLRYYKIPIGPTKIHESSSQPGFSLTVKDNDFKKFKIFNPKYLPGDCTIHHSTSIHFADEVPKHSKRVNVVRIALHALSDFVRPEHKEWYEMMVKNNRNKLK